MTTPVDLCNRALLILGSQRIISSLSQDSVEAKACNTIYNNTRDDLLRKAPWDCAFNTANLVYITSVPGTPENTSPVTTLWQKGQPSPPWTYEYQYPVDCLKACWITPQTATGYAGSIPITPVVTGGASSYWQGQPVRFKIAVDQFYPVIQAIPAAGGAGYVLGEVITLAGTIQGNPPIGAPAVLIVVGIGGGGAITDVSIVNQVTGEVDSGGLPFGGSYFIKQSGVVAQGSTTGSGVGATFNLISSNIGDQRVILTNQEFAILNYVKQVTDTNVFDTLFQSALQNILGAQLAMILIGDKNLANQALVNANNAILEARKADANEGLTVNDFTPDWIRIRGINYSDGYVSGPYSGFDWGSTWPLY